MRTADREASLKETKQVAQDFLHDSGDTWLPYPRYLLRKHLVKKILGGKDVVRRKCLEIGYGSGDMLLLYAKLGMEAYGYDYSPLAFVNASNRIAMHAELEGNIILYEKESDMKQRKYDYLMAYEVLEHIQDDGATLSGWKNMLAPRGQMIISVPAHKHKWGASDIAVGHYRRYEKDELIALCGKCGITVHTIWCYGFPLSLLLDPLLHSSRKGEASAYDGARKEDRSKESGVKRKKNIFYRLLFNDIVLFPFYVLQDLFLGRDWGSGYIVVGEATGKAN